MLTIFFFFFFFFFNDTATTEIYTLSLHDALPISSSDTPEIEVELVKGKGKGKETEVVNLEDIIDVKGWKAMGNRLRSEEHTSELQSHSDLVCRLLLEKKKKKKI